MSFSDLLAAAIDRANSVACVGLDPVIERIPAAITARHHDPVQSIQEFCNGVIDAVAPHVGVVKPQSACFERYGQAGVGVLRRVIQHARDRGLVVVLDAKRGDIGVTAEHYAHAAFAHEGADAVTLNGYMGPDAIEPFLNPPSQREGAGGWVRDAHKNEVPPRSPAPGQPTPSPSLGEGGRSRGVFILVRTSNPGSDAIQSHKIVDGRTVAELVADMVTALGATRRGVCGLSDVGAVVGATKSAEAAALRARMPDAFFLIPGYGAQGGTLEDLRPCLRPTRIKDRPSTSGILVNASRSVLYPKADGASDWQTPIESAARQLVSELRAL